MKKEYIRDRYSLDYALYNAKAFIPENSYIEKEKEILSKIKSAKILNARIKSLSSLIFFLYIDRYDFKKGTLIKYNSGKIEEFTRISSNRSLIDGFAVAKNYFPEITFKHFVYAINAVNVFHDDVFFCNDIKRYVFYVNKNESKERIKRKLDKYNLNLKR